MIKKKTTIEDVRVKRSYESDYVFAFFMDASGEGRWIQEPAGFANGTPLFFAALEALRVCAEDDGVERYKEAARAALNTIKSYEPEGN